MIAYPNRRLRVPGLEDAAARVCLCCQVGRFGFAADSPTETAMLDGGTGQLIGEALVYAQTLRLRGRWLADWLRQSPLRDRLLLIGMYAEVSLLLVVASDQK